MAELRIVTQLNGRAFGYEDELCGEAAALIKEMAAALERIRRGKRVDWDSVNFTYEALDEDEAREIARTALAKLGGEHG